MTQIDFLSVVIPAYNEAARIGKTVRAAGEYLAKQPYQWEILVVNDGSRDSTGAQVRALATTAPGLRLMEHPANQGKGAAVRTGLNAARGDAVLFCDADGATPIKEIEKLLPHLRDGIGIVSGSRKIHGSRVLIRQRCPRRMMGRVYQWLCRMLVNPGVNDVTCGFKLLSREAARICGARMRIRRWSFDAEMFAIAKAHRLKIVEVPIRWIDRRRTKVRLLKDSLGSFWELVRIRRHAAQGLYR